MIMLPVATQQEASSRGQTQKETIPHVQQSGQEVRSEAKYDGQSRQKVKIGRLINTL